MQVSVPVQLQVPSLESRGSRVMVPEVLGDSALASKMVSGETGCARVVVLGALVWQFS